MKHETNEAIRVTLGEGWPYILPSELLGHNLSLEAIGLYACFIGATRQAQQDPDWDCETPVEVTNEALAAVSGEPLEKVKAVMAELIAKGIMSEDANVSV
ncbi:MAG: hypothetical protein WD716_11365 [Fimbriimonadaceae bacterium]